jgi:hypothetical protein
VRTRTAVSLLCAGLVLSVLIQCGGGSTPTSNPTAVPTATPTATPTPGSGLPAGMVCDPTPPPLYGIMVKVHDGPVLDSKPIVINVDGYCEKQVGTGGKFCDTRLEGDPQRVACDYLAVGKALDTGRWGPTWYFNDQPCDGANLASCANHATDQFLVRAKTDGTFRACAASTVPVWSDGGSNCGECKFVNGDCAK